MTRDELCTKVMCFRMLSADDLARADEVCAEIRRLYSVIVKQGETRRATIADRVYPYALSLVNGRTPEEMAEIYRTAGTSDMSRTQAAALVAVGMADQLLAALDEGL